MGFVWGVSFAGRPLTHRPWETELCLLFLRRFAPPPEQGTRISWAKFAGSRALRSVPPAGDTRPPGSRPNRTAWPRGTLNAGVAAGGKDVQSPIPPAFPTEVSKPVPQNTAAFSRSASFHGRRGWIGGWSRLVRIGFPPTPTRTKLNQPTSLTGVAGLVPRTAGLAQECPRSRPGILCRRGARKRNRAKPERASKQGSELQRRFVAQPTAPTLQPCRGGGGAG